MKPTRWVASYPRCPFYKYTEKQCVHCDGEEFSTLRISFPDNAERDSYMRKYCGKNFEDCPVYDAFVRHM